MRKLRWIAGLALAWMVGSFPACGTMGGGMKYMVDPPEVAAWIA